MDGDHRDEHRDDERYARERNEHTGQYREAAEHLEERDYPGRGDREGNADLVKQRTEARRAAAPLRESMGQEAIPDHESQGE